MDTQSSGKAVCPGCLPEAERLNAQLFLGLLEGPNAAEVLGLSIVEYTRGVGIVSEED